MESRKNIYTNIALKLTKIVRRQKNPEGSADFGNFLTLDKKSEVEAAILLSIARRDSIILFL